MKILVGTYRADKDLLLGTLNSLTEHVKGFAEGRHELFFIDDSGQDDDSAWGRWLVKHGKMIYRGPDREPWGFSGAMRAVTSYMRYWSECGWDEGKHYCWWEEDTVAVAPVDLGEMVGRLRQDGSLAQVALLRQPIFDAEIEAGGLENFLDCDWEDGLWTQRQVFTANPAVWAPSAYAEDWPQVEGSEAAKTRQLLAKNLRFAYWPGQRVRHDGTLKDGVGY